MKICRLTVRNIGLYAGEHHFDLQTGAADDAKRNLILFQGHNGAGKSTLFLAIRLALHGAQTLGDRISRQHYNDFLLSRMHRKTSSERTVTEASAHAAVEFDYIQSGQPQRIYVERSWERNGSVVEEALTIFQNGNPLDIEHSDYQDWLNERLSPGITAICFFDAERLDSATSMGQQQYLAETLRRLLGLDLVERLQADLEAYGLRQGGLEKLDRLREESRQANAIMDDLDVQWNRLQQEGIELATEEERLHSELIQAERRLAAEGGTYAARRPLWQEQLNVIQQERETLEAQLREACGGLLPFALAPNLCQSLSRRLNSEAQQHRKQMTAALWQQTAAQLGTAVAGPEMWADVTLSAADRKRLTARFLHLLQTMGESEDKAKVRLVHQLAEQEQERLQDWIIQSKHSIPQLIDTLGTRLQTLQADQRRLEENLQSAPEEEDIASFVSEIERLTAALAEMHKRQAQLAEERGGVQFRRTEQGRKLLQITNQLEAAALLERQMALATNSKRALITYQDALTRQRLKALEVSLIENFNVICRKKQLLPASYIDPKDFTVHLQGLDGTPILLSDFSAGERQLYALALLQAFRQVSRQQLPLLIDTPLARLDEGHRVSLIENYFPVVSDQVLLFATDAELNPELLEQLQPYIAHRYVLRYDVQAQQTAVETESIPQVRSA